MVPFPLFDRIEIRSLKILHQCQGENRLVVDVLDDRRDLLPAELRRSPKSALAGDQLEPVLPRTASDGYRLEEAARVQALLELEQFLGVELSARLIRIAANLRDGD